MIAPFLIHVDPSKPFVLKMDDFDFVVDVMLSLGEDNFLYHVNFHSHKFSPT